MARSSTRDRTLARRPHDRRTTISTIVLVASVDDSCWRPIKSLARYFIWPAHLSARGDTSRRDAFERGPQVPTIATQWSAMYGAGVNERRRARLAPIIAIIILLALRESGGCMWESVAEPEARARAPTQTHIQIKQVFCCFCFRFRSRSQFRLCKCARPILYRAKLSLARALSPPLPGPQRRQESSRLVA